MRDILFVICSLILISITLFYIPIAEVALERINEPYPDYCNAIDVKFEEIK